MLNVCHYAVRNVSVLDGRFQTGTVNFNAHAFNSNNQYTTFLKVYKYAAKICALHKVLVIFTTSFRVLQLMYRSLS